MPRWVVPSWFVLYGADLVEAVKLGLEEELLGRLGDILAEREDHQPPEETGPPVSLRWTTFPSLGFPRAPFEVWRRRRDYRAVQLLTTPLVVNGQTSLGWANDMYLVGVGAEPDPGFSLTVRPLDVRGKPIPGERLDFSAAGTSIFRAPGITGLAVSGRGRLLEVAGVDANELANEPDWVRIDTVGFPFDAGEVALPDYDPLPQGYEPASLTGLEAAKLRLEIARILHVPLPATGVPGIPEPPWPAPDPGGFLDVLRAAHPSPLSLVLACLQNSDDNDPALIQALYTESFVYPGIRQADVPGATAGDDATFDLPVVGATMLATSSDSSAATGLGYGTVDLPPRKSGDSVSLTHVVARPDWATGWDYMVTATFTLPFFGPLELAALVQPLPPPDPAANLTAAAFGANRPSTRDAAASESVRLGWDLTARAQSFGVLFSDAYGSATLLNTPRPVGVGGHYPFVPQRPPSVDGDPPAGVRTTFVDPVASVPISGSRTSSYLVIGLDVFDRWSGWVQTTHTASAPPVVAPGLHSAKLELDVPSASGRVVPSTLVVDVSWDWADRSPDRIELYGQFFPASATSVPAPTFTGGVQLGPSSAVGAPAVIRFDVLGNPSLQAPYTGSVEVLAPPPQPQGVTLPPTASADVRTYRVRLKNVSCDFTGADALAYSVTGRGAEAVRPGVPSAVVGPKIARAPDPLPSNPPTLPVDVIWTALPDAAGKARAVLSWPASPGAVGYFVWEATEGALLAAVGQPDPAHGTPLLTRAATLSSAITGAGQAASLQAFTRLNERAIQETKIELELPGSADTIYAYRVSSVTSQGVESQRSPTAALVAVPRRNLPGTPRLLVRPRREPMAGIEVIVMPGPEPAAAGFRIHRVRSGPLAEHVGTMGPAKILPTDPGWQSRQVMSRLAPPEGGFAVLDQVTESWHPYYYRAVALGADDPASGQYTGESEPSGTQWAVLAPATAPTASLDDVSANAATRLVTFTADLPVRATPVGRATVAISQLADAPDGRSTQRTTLLTADVAAVPEAPALTLAGTAPPEPEITRRAPNGSGDAEYTVLLDAAIAHGAIVLTDPLARTVEQMF